MVAPFYFLISPRAARGDKGGFFKRNNNFMRNRASVKIPA
jgi:hypothetical protein